MIPPAEVSRNAKPIAARRAYSLLSSCASSGALRAAPWPPRQSLVRLPPSLRPPLSTRHGKHAVVRAGNRRKAATVMGSGSPVTAGRMMLTKTRVVAAVRAVARACAARAGGKATGTLLV